ncbi:MAG: SulP family inorganic anion transporter [Actinomycetota bacterium]|nr:SulP family inorganic anion transporter [Actinomycetota bacterium]
MTADGRAGAEGTAGDEVDQPGLSELREAVANAARRVPGGTIRRDAVAGLNGALASVPDGMASGLLAGVNPIYGLYACIAGPIAGGVLSSTQLMVVATTSASALGAGEALAALPEDERTNALFLMVALIGVLQIVFGILQLGRLTRFVSYSVMTGFVAGIAVRTILTQLPAVTGYEPSGDNDVARTLDLVGHANQIDLRILAVAAAALVLALLIGRTPLGRLSTLVAIVGPSLVIVLLGIGGVPAVRDVGEIPTGLPLPSIPSLAAISPEVVSGAFAVAIIILVQGTGVSQSVPNPDGSRRSVSRDFIGQGAANVASGLLQGLPVGGSLSTTALTMLSGARSRLTPIFAGLWMAAIVMALSGLVSRIAMPTLAMVLIIATVSTIKPRDVRAVWTAGWPSRLAGLVTFAGVLLLPVQVAVLIGVGLSLALYVMAAAADVSVVELVERDDGRIEEREPSKTLESERVTVLDVYGHLFFAGARTLDRRLPRVDEARSPAVVIRLRGRTHVGATLVDVLSSYAGKVEEAGGRLYLTGLGETVRDELARSGKIRLDGPVAAYEATPVLGESTRRAVGDARAWLVERRTAETSSSPAGAPSNEG